jgi:hypothetical protein
MRKTTTVAFATALFAALTIQAAAPHTGLAQAPVEIPLHTRAGRLVVPARAADGTELTFLVSTGSAVTVLSGSGLEKIGEQGVTIGSVAVNMEGRETVSDADLTVEGLVMDGLVSNNTLNEFDILFDVPGGRMVLKPFGRSVEWPGMRLSDPVMLRIYHGVVVGLDLKIDGTDYPAMLELGAPALLANEAVLQENGTTGGSVDLTLGSVVFEGLPIELSDHPVISRFSPNGDGFVLVGTAPALDCAISLSWVHRELRTCIR